MHFWLPISIALFVAFSTTGCVTTDGEDLARTDQGLAEVRLDPQSLSAFDVSSVTIDSATQSQEIFFNPATGTFDGTVLLDAGGQTLVARAFSGARLVGQSNPVAVDIQPGLVTRVVMRILEVAGPPPPPFGPIFDSLVHPTTTDVDTTVTFALSVIAPSGSQVSYSWTTGGCSDATFTAPAGAVTGWSKATPGGCTIQVVASSNGFSLVQSFAIAVFPDGAATGGADVTTVFVSAPVVDLTFFDLGCYVGPSTNASCSGTAAAPAAQAYASGVLFWGNSAPGTFEVFDDCGGRFGIAQHDSNQRSGHWMPPTAGGLCIITARAVNGDGLVGERSAAILTRPGTPAVAAPPHVFAQTGIFQDCHFTSADGPLDCGIITTGSTLFAFGHVNWADGHPGSLTITDNCSGDFPAPSSAFNFSGEWTPEGFGSTCTLTINATSLEGISRIASASFLLQ